MSLPTDPQGDTPSKVFATESGLPPAYTSGSVSSCAPAPGLPGPGLGSSPASLPTRVIVSDTSDDDAPLVPRRPRRRVYRSPSPSGQVIATSPSEGVDV
eukprot:12603727-Prorocentrum_lima.AAC.1